MFEYLFPSYEDWVNQFISRRKRRQIAYSLSLLGIIAASFFAFQDVYLKLEAKEQDLSQVYRMSGVRGYEESTRAIEKLREENKQLNAELSSTRNQLSALETSLKPRRLTAEEQHKFTNALALYDGRQFGVIELTTGLGCHECMIYRDEIVKTINAVPGWRARSIIETAIRPDLIGLVVGVKDSKAPPATPHVLRLHPFLRQSRIRPDQFFPCSAPLLCISWRKLCSAENHLSFSHRRDWYGRADTRGSSARHQ